MTSRIARHRARAYVDQRALCYYCQCNMCVGDPEEFARSYGISDRLARQVRCTAEHLTARRDGGTDNRSNIAAVCWHCNRLRHACKTPMPADRYRDYVRKRICRGAWHDRLILENLYSSNSPLVKRLFESQAAIAHDKASLIARTRNQRLGLLMIRPYAAVTGFSTSFEGRPNALDGRRGLDGPD